MNEINIVFNGTNIYSPNFIWDTFENIMPGQTSIRQSILEKHNLIKHRSVGLITCTALPHLSKAYRFDLSSAPGRWSFLIDQ